MNTEFEKWVDETWEKVDAKLKKVAVRSRDKLPNKTDENGVHDNYGVQDPVGWTNGFFGGMMWLMFVATGNEDYKKTAIRSEELLDAGLKMCDRLYHDVGFMWHILSGVNWRLNKDEASKTRNLYAANVLAGRYNIKGEFIRAWNEDHVIGWSIIDCMMNIPLLYWASRELKDDRFKYVAMAHADMTMREHVRDDGSVRHIVEHPLEAPGVVAVYGGQGYNENSAWSRGTAWGLYGFTLSYIHTQKEDYLNTAKKIANYFIAACCSDWKVRADFRVPEEPVEYDSSAAVIAACGLLELAKCVPEYEKKMYYSAAVNLIKTVDENFCNYDTEIDHIVEMCTDRYCEDVNDVAVHHPLIYADYFYVEALMKLKNIDFLAW